MSKRKRNYSRFYALAKEKHIDLEQHKEVLVSQFTDGRTSSLREMTIAEYEDMCDCLQSGKQRGESSEAYQARLRKARSAVLNRMQRLGVDTSDKTFAAVNKFCMNPRISGKLEALIPKLEAILRKPKVQGPIPIFFNPNRHQLPS